MIPHYSFPRTRFVDESGITRQLLHIVSEFWEIIKALAVGNLEHAVHESFDLIHSIETLIRKIVLRAMRRDKTINPITIKLDVINKNRSRNYYTE
jgi:hypothetical protein